MEQNIAAVAALDEPTRRRLYDFVVAQPVAVGRDEAAQAVGVPRPTAAFHLDKLAEEGLLEVVFERRTGKSGPGAGRPAKLYKRSANELRVSLPERRYDLVAQLLAAAVEEGGALARAALERKAMEQGTQLAPKDDDAVLAVLAEHGYEPTRDGDGYVLRNCPFHALAQEHRALICGANLNLLQGVLCKSRFIPRLAPQEGYCCVRLD
ncbi:ArsR family transcriptional regulator [Lentzea sp. NBRC 105346]|uniref:helix-turn-helix transcriptional regulator n=1 Tax=Lentzea sp. NBRC 105346 TaxID=3032205 RepID=UPI0024A19AA3|nr:helix-turn-helix domain-containing protein [Lentzea sp. NBRC 105346]GLZ32372.1 ArsR family transcriptional regulator [Lentzea sp. NBRC 105346]